MDYLPENIVVCMTSMLDLRLFPSSLSPQIGKMYPCAFLPTTAQGSGFPAPSLQPVRTPMRDEYHSSSTHADTTLSAPCPDTISLPPPWLSLRCHPHFTYNKPVKRKLVTKTPQPVRNISHSFTLQHLYGSPQSHDTRGMVRKEEPLAQPARASGLSSTIDRVKNHREMEPRAFPFLKLARFFCNRHLPVFVIAAFPFL